MTKKLVGFVCVLVIASAIGASSAHAATLSGWAWSETFGWFSFNSSDSGAGGGPYAVSINSSGDWSGYAWSPNAGWLSFNSSDVSVCGSAGHLNTANGAVTGWARVISYATNEGCVELSGTNHTSPANGGSGGVTYDSNSGVFKGWAWGGDPAAHSGVGWMQFNPSGASNPVRCLSGDCGYGGSIAGTCTRSPSTAYFTAPTNVTFTASATNGDAPYHYNWNSAGYDTQSPTNQFTASYSSSAPGPLVVIKDNGNLVSSSISCPSVSIVNPLGSTNLQIGRTAATANLSQLTVKQTNPFALKWNFTMTSDYSCSATVSPNPNNSSWNSNWIGSLSGSDNLDGTYTWSGNTGTNLKAGTATSGANSIAPGIYQFGIYCTSNATPTPGAPQSVNTTLKIDSSSVKEI
jgi:hypothetical protein